MSLTDCSSDNCLGGVIPVCSVNVKSLRALDVLPEVHGFMRNHLQPIIIIGGGQGPRLDICHQICRDICSLESCRSVMVNVLTGRLLIKSGPAFHLPGCLCDRCVGLSYQIVINIRISGTCQISEIDKAGAESCSDRCDLARDQVDNSHSGKILKPEGSFILEMSHKSAHEGSELRRPGESNIKLPSENGILAFIYSRAIEACFKDVRLPYLIHVNRLTIIQLSGAGAGGIRPCLVIRLERLISIADLSHDRAILVIIPAQAVKSAVVVAI